MPRALGIPGEPVPRTATDSRIEAWGRQGGTRDEKTTTEENRREMERTPSLSNSEQPNRRELQALAVLTDPQYAGLTEAKAAEAAGLTYATFRRIKARPAFRDYHRRYVETYVRERIPEVLAGMFTNAKERGRDGYKDRELLVKIGLPVERESGEGQVAVRVQILEVVLSGDSRGAIEGNERIPAIAGRQVEICAPSGAAAGVAER